jgi:D-3-phosphoglycerate dehydrogenase
MSITTLDTTFETLTLEESLNEPMTRISQLRGLRVRKRFVVAITDTPFESGDKEQAILSRIGASVRKFNCSNEMDVTEAARDAHVILCDASPITRNVITALSHLVGVVEYGIGYDNIDVNAATEHRVVVCNLPDFMTSEVADHAVALILTLARKLHRIGPSTRAGEWNWRRFRPINTLEGKTVGIIGFGNIGRQVAERMRSFKTHVIAYDPYVPREVIEKGAATPTSLGDLLKSSDIITIHVPLTKETKQLIGEKEFGSMKDSVLLVNTSRGSVIDQEALIASIRMGKIGAAGLDVLTKEPPNRSDPILALDNVIITPHIGWYSEQSSSRLQEHAALEAERILTGKPPKHPINPQVLSKTRSS